MTFSVLSASRLSLTVRFLACGSEMAPPLLSILVRVISKEIIMAEQHFHDDFKKMTAVATAVCVQDQYGNQYTFTVDAAHGYITGHATNHQGCAGGTWPLLGSFEATSGGTMVEFTFRNPRTP